MRAKPEEIPLPMNIAPHAYRGLLAALMLGLAVPVTARADMQVGPAGSGREVHIIKDRAASQVVSYVYSGIFAYVRIEHAEAGAAPNEHPLAIDPVTLRSMLAGITEGKSGESDPVFSDEELTELAGPLARALGSATSGQDVCFAIPGRHGFGGPLATRSVTTGRVFRKDGQLQLIFGLIHEPFEAQFLQSGVLRPFDPGQRIAALTDNPPVSAVSGQSHRADWLALAIPAPAAAAPAPAPVVAASPPPATAVAPAPPAATAVAPMTSTPLPDTDRAAAQIAQRLRILGKLREQGLITEQEYQDKRAQILHEL